MSFAKAFVTVVALALVVVFFAASRLAIDCASCGRSPEYNVTYFALSINPESGFLQRFDRAQIIYAGKFRN